MLGAPRQMLSCHMSHVMGDAAMSGVLFPTSSLSSLESLMAFSRISLYHFSWNSFSLYMKISICRYNTPSGCCFSVLPSKRINHIIASGRVHIIDFILLTLLYIRYQSWTSSRPLKWHMSFYRYKKIFGFDLLMLCRLLPAIPAIPAAMTWKSCVLRSV